MMWRARVRGRHLAIYPDLGVELCGRCGTGPRAAPRDRAPRCGTVRPLRARAAPPAPPAPRRPRRERRASETRRNTGRARMVASPGGSKMSIFGSRKTQRITAAEALPGREAPIVVPQNHEVLGSSLTPPYPAGTEIAEFALGCFWGAEKTYWNTTGVVSTAVGYEGGFTRNPTYEEVCSGQTGHAETVRVVYDPAKISYEQLLKIFWESHNPTQGMRQGNDIGTQYRSAIFYQNDAQREVAEMSAAAYGKKLAEAGFGAITTEIVPASEF